MFTRSITSVRIFLTFIKKGVIRESSERGKDIEKAVDYYKRAAIEGELNALTDLAYLLENGKYVNKDVREAYKLLKIAADRHFPRALNNLGIMLFNNLIQDKEGANDRKAFEYFQRAADQGYAKAFTNLGKFTTILMLKLLGICYEKGRGISKSMLKALE
jgi:TPR repeat protein